MEEKVQHIEGNNITLQKYNKIFGEDNDRLSKENDMLKLQLTRYRNRDSNVARPSKRLHRSGPGSPDEEIHENRVAEARVKIFSIVNL